MINTSSEDEILNVLESVNKSVVHINTVRVVRDYYNRRMPLKGSGSGFILESDGHIVTNAHVVRQAGKIGVVLWDNKPVEGVILGSCRSIDIALVKIDADDLPAARLGDSDKIRVGQSVYAIGNPFGLVGGPTVTRGVISALDRSIQSREASFTGLVQTDASINPGNSGGPLVDTKGRVIAINTAVIPYAQGIGFAIPSDTILREIVWLVNGQEYEHSWIGVTGMDMSYEIAQAIETPTTYGWLIVSVMNNSPAEKAGLKGATHNAEIYGQTTPIGGDIILAINNTGILNGDDISKYLEEHTRPSQTISITVERDGSEILIPLILEPRPPPTT